MTPRHPSLKWRLIGRLVLWQGVTLAALIAMNVLALAYLWSEGAFGHSRGQAAYEALSQAVVRDPAGQLQLRQSRKLDALRAEVKDFWFLLQDGNGRRLSEGTVPDGLRDVVPMLDQLESGTVGRTVNGSFAQLGVVATIETAGGPVRMLANDRGNVTLAMMFNMAETNLIFGGVFVMLMALTTLIVTPFVVRRALAGLDEAAGEAARIDVKRADVRLTTDRVPREIMPLVGAVNAALDRLDTGYERQRRFLADAAHELRTPITILGIRIWGLPASAERTRLVEDTKRLTVLAGQLLDFQRLDGQGVAFAPVDIVAVAERVVVDLAPLAFAAGYEMTFEPGRVAVVVDGDEGALERVITNLVQNAIDHGGKRGSITLSVTAPVALPTPRPASLMVCDDGDGIPEAERETIFDPFRRLKRGGLGAGLGLDLVQRIMHLHGGHARVVGQAGRGACMQLTFAPSVVEGHRP